MSGFYVRRGKRAFDVAAASAGLVLVSPVLLIAAAAVRWKLGSPVLFRQERGGLDGSVFVLVKFRSLTDERDASGHLLPDVDRMTQFGGRLRSLSIDELPALINVIRGDMSLVGPRPLLTRYLPRYSAVQRRRHEVRPGFTGWAQVNGRNLVDWESRFELDVWYVDHLSLGLDLKILWRTLTTVVRGTGVSQAGEATMQEFIGSDAPESPEP